MLILQQYLINVVCCQSQLLFLGLIVSKFFFFKLLGIGIYVWNMHRNAIWETGKKFELLNQYIPLYFDCWVFLRTFKRLSVRPDDYLVFIYTAIGNCISHSREACGCISQIHKYFLCYDPIPIETPFRLSKFVIWLNKGENKQKFTGIR